MTKSDFLKEEFNSLREEITATKDRIFKIVGFGIVVIPSASSLAKSLDLESIGYFLPFMVIVIGLLYIAENNALMRCGRFIRERIELEVPDHVGWETWLEREDNREARLVDKYVTICIYILFSVYYFGTVYIAYKMMQCSVAHSFQTFLTLIYILAGLLFGIFLIRNARHTTSTKSASESAETDRTNETTSNG